MRAGAALAALALLAAGCAPATRVVLLPQADGTIGAVEVSARESSAVLNAPYQTAAVRTRSVDVDQMDAKQVADRYAPLLAAQPEAAQHFTLYFVTGGSELTPESMNALADVLSRATARPGGEIVITGHTDRVGSVESNDALSLQRASAVRELVIQRGFDAARVDAVGRGEREPIVPTADEVDEPKNRRAEIVVR